MNSYRQSGCIILIKLATMGVKRLARVFFAIVCMSSLSYFLFLAFCYDQDGHDGSFVRIVSNFRARSHISTELIRPTSSISSNPAEWPTPPPTCNRKVNIAYIKTHKTASTTLQTIFNRFGFFNSLSFIFNRKSGYNGHFDYMVVDENSARNNFLPPIGIRDGDYKNYQNYNMIAVHVRYYRKSLDLFMASGTQYVTIIREPSAQWESAFNHFDFRRAILTEADDFGSISINSTHWVSFDPQSSSGDYIREFMRRPETYHRILKTIKYQGSAHLLWYYARNNQISDLGLEPEYHDDEALVNETIDRLDKEFSMVIITEFFDESLLVMKKMLCWTFEDILYISKNQRLHRSKLSEDTRERIHQWNRADVLLYDHFNKTLWKKINEYGPSFSSDLAKFRRLLNETRETCTVTSKVQGKTFQHVEFMAKAESSLFCHTVAEGKRQLFTRVYKRQSPKRAPKQAFLQKLQPPVPKRPEWPGHKFREDSVMRESLQFQAQREHQPRLKNFARPKVEEKPEELFVSFLDNWDIK